MAPVMFARTWRAGVDRQIATDPLFASGLHDVLERLNDADLPDAALDHVVSQPWRQDRRDWYDAAGLIEVGRRLQAGWCVTFSVSVSAEPGRDKDEDGNNAKLLALPSPFAATFAGGRGDNDGRFAWTETIEVEHDMGDAYRMKVRYPPAEVPLEVGRTEPETTMWHLLEEGGVARWPYKSERVTLLSCDVQLHRTTDRYANARLRRW